MGCVPSAKRKDRTVDAKRKNDPIEEVAFKACDDGNSVPTMSSLKHHRISSFAADDQNLDLEAFSIAELCKMSIDYHHKKGELQRQITDELAKRLGQEKAECGPNRGLSVHFIRTNMLDDLLVPKDGDAKVYEVEETVRKRGEDATCPLDGRPGAAYVFVARDKYAGCANYMLSYTWGYWLRYDILASLESFCRSSGLSQTDTRVWMCFYCVNQHRVRELRASGGTVSFDDFRSTFFGRILEIKRVISLLSPWDDPSNLKRLWCCFELFYAITTPGCELNFVVPDGEYNKFADSLIRGTVGTGNGGTIAGVASFTAALSHWQMQNAKATIKADQQNILKILAPGVDAEDTVGLAKACYRHNEVIVSQVKKWFVERSIESMNERPASEISPVSCLSIGWMLVTQGRHEEALELYKRHLCQECIGTYNHAALKYGRAQCFRRQGKVSEALDEYMVANNEFATLAPRPDRMEHCGTLMGLAILYDQMHRHDIALDYFNRCMDAFEQSDFRHGSDHANGFKHRGKCLRKLGRRSEALLSFCRAKELFEQLQQTENEWYYDALAHVALEYLFVGKLEDAFVLVRRSEAGYQALGMTAHSLYKELMQIKKDWQRAALACRHHASIMDLENLLCTVLSSESKVPEKRMYKLGDITFNYEAFGTAQTYIFDSEGVISQLYDVRQQRSRKELEEAAVEIVNFLISRGKRTLFLTSSLVSTKAELVKTLNERGINVDDPTSILSSACTCASYLKNIQIRRPLVLASSKSVLEELEHVGITEYCATIDKEGNSKQAFLLPVSDDNVANLLRQAPLVDAVVVGGDQEITGMKAAVAANCLKCGRDSGREIQLVTCSTTRSGSVRANGPMVDPKSLNVTAVCNNVMTKAISNCFDPEWPIVDVSIASENMFKHLQDTCSVDLKKAILVSTVEHNIATAKNRGMRTLLVMSGATAKADWEADLVDDGARPTWVLPSVGDILEWMPANEKEKCMTKVGNLESRCNAEAWQRRSHQDRKRSSQRAVEQKEAMMRMILESDEEEEEGHDEHIHNRSQAKKKAKDKTRVPRSSKRSLTNTVLP